jgi:hypothetical protein
VNHRFLAIPLLFLSAACGGEANSRDGSLTREQFIEINVALRALEATPRPPLPFMERGAETVIPGIDGERADSVDLDSDPAGEDTSAAEREANSIDARRAAVLESFGVTEEQVRAFIAEGSHSPRQLKEIWDDIGLRLEPPRSFDPSPTAGEAEI